MDIKFPIGVGFELFTTNNNTLNHPANGEAVCYCMYSAYAVIYHSLQQPVQRQLTNHYGLDHPVFKVIALNFHDTCQRNSIYSAFFGDFFVLLLFRCNDGIFWMLV
jgi:hypothetical protein